MPSIKDLKKRISTVRNTQQTTKAMKMVSAAKLRRAQEAISNQRPYAKRILSLIQKVSLGLQGSDKYPLLHREKPFESDSQKKILLVLVTSDRGLCGGFNANVIKSTQRWVQSQKGAMSIQLAFVGKRGHDFFKTKSVPVSTFYSELGGKVTYSKAKKLADDLVSRYLQGEFDEVKFIYNEFVNAVTQKVIVEDFLPLAGRQDSGSDSNSSGVTDSAEFVVKPSADEVLQVLLTKNFEIQAFRILLESQAGEHGARMSAMENATKNAGEMIRKLTLQYNKQRQAGITKELLEIIAGSESQKG